MEPKYDIFATLTEIIKILIGFFRNNKMPYALSDCRNQLDISRWYINTAIPLYETLDRINIFYNEMNYVITLCTQLLSLPSCGVHRILFIFSFTFPLHVAREIGGEIHCHWKIPLKIRILKRSTWHKQRKIFLNFIIKPALLSPPQTHTRIYVLTLRKNTDRERNRTRKAKKRQD